MTDDAQPFSAKISQAFSRPEARWIVLSNAIPIAGVLFFGWPAFSLLLFYWIENLVIGLFNALKIAVSGFSKSKATAGFTAFLIPFFFFHYGMFCFVHGIFLVAMFSMAGSLQESAGHPSDMFGLAAVVWQQLQTDFDLRLSVYGLVAVHAAWFAVLWLGNGTWRTANPLLQMFEPYGRIVVMHLTIMVATLPVLLLGEPLIAVIALAVLKCGLELGLPLVSIDLTKIKDPSIDRFSR